VACLNEETILGFVNGRLAPSELARVESHARDCVRCQELVAAALTVASSAPPASKPSPMGGAAMSRAELSCRYLMPLLTLAEERGPAVEMAGFLSSWNTSVEALRDEAGWVSLRFCEGLTEWLAARVGIDAIVSQTLRDSYAPSTMGILYPFVRAFGSPRVGYGRMPSLVRLLNRASDVQVIAIQRNRATIAYLPRSEATRERSPLICQVRRAQIAAGPTVWNLPPAVVAEAECQALGGDRCVYHVAWVQPSRWWQSVFAGIIAAALAWISTGGNWPAVLLALIAGITVLRLWGARRDLQELRGLDDVKMNVLSRVTRLQPLASPPGAAGRDGEAAPASVAATSAPADNDVVVATPPQPGELLASRYRLGPLLGAGGMGFVYSAVDEAAGQTVALKVLRPELSLNPRWVKRMEQEVRMARTIEHPHVCRVMSFGQVDGHCFLTMELATGGNLARELRTPGAPPKEWEDRVGDVRAIVQGLVAVHDAGIVHRDLTPQNILRLSGGRLVIADFGLAVDQPGRTTPVAGTPNRIAPEVLAGGKVSFSSDIWQLGLIMREVLFGLRPDSTAAAAATDPLAQQYLGLCAACLREDASARPPNAAAVAQLLSSFDG
jgi:hypothetical protein